MNSRAGVRCRARFLVRAVKGNIPPQSLGSIRYEAENLGRRIVCVQWDIGFASVVFPDEIELEEGEHNAYDAA